MARTDRFRAKREVGDRIGADPHEGRIDLALMHRDCGFPVLGFSDEVFTVVGKVDHLVVADLPNATAGSIVPVRAVETQGRSTRAR